MSDAAHPLEPSEKMDAEGGVRLQEELSEEVRPPEQPASTDDANSLPEGTGAGGDEQGVEDLAVEAIAAGETPTSGDPQTESATGTGSEETAQGVPGESFRAGRDGYIADRDINIINGAAVEQAEFGKLSSETLARLEAVFVEPAGYLEALNAAFAPREARVILVHGTDHSGKWTCAVNLAREIARGRFGASREDPRLFQYARPSRSEIPLAEAMESEDLPERSVVLLKDCFERNVRSEELEASDVDRVLEPLLRNDCVLVLTGDLPLERLEDLAVVDLAASLPDLREVLSKHLRYAVLREGLPLPEEEIEGLVGRSWSRLRPHLVTPFHIRQFCAKLAQTLSDVAEQRPVKALLLPLAKSVAIGGSQVARSWFDSLRPNERLFSLLVFLFDGAERRWLEELSHELVCRLRAARFEWLSDPRVHGLEDVRERIQAIEQGGRLEFEDRIYEREVRRQVGNLRHLLWDTLQFLVDLAPIEDWAQGWKRQALGVALGRLGVHDRPRLTANLCKMGTDGERRRAVVPGYALQEMARGEPEDLDFVMELLGRWIIRSRDHRLMWAAAAAVWRVYLALHGREDDGQTGPARDALLQLLGRLATRLNDFLSDPREHEDRGRIIGANFSCVVEAMRRITLADPARAVPVVGKWILAVDKNQTQVSRRVARAVFETFARGRNRPGLANQQALLGLVSPLLEKAGDESLDLETVFLTLRAWLQSPELAGQIRRELLLAATFSGAQPRERLRSIVSRLWLDPRPAAAEAAAVRLNQSRRRGRVKVSEQQEQKEARPLVVYWCYGTEQAAHRIAQEVVARCFAVGGALPSLPGMGRGVAIVEPTLLLPGESAGASLWSLLALLESRMDLTFLRLGDSEPVEFFGASFSALELLPRFPGHRLMMPGLEAPSLEGTESLFVLAPRKPHDLDDLSDCVGRRAVHYLGPSVDGGASGADWYVHLDLTWPASLEDLERAVAVLEIGWARDLASAPADRWKAWARGLGVEISGEFGYRAKLEKLASRGAIPSEGLSAREDPIWKSVVLALVWAAADLPSCLEWVGAWLTLPDEEEEAPVKRVVAAAAALALVRLFTAYPPDQGGVSRAPTLLFELLATPLAQVPDGIDTLLRLVGHWLEDLTWASFLAGDVREGRGRLERWCSDHLRDRPELVNQLEERLATCRPAAGPEDSWAALAAVVDRLRALRALESPRHLPGIGPHQRYAVLALDAGFGDEQRRMRLAEITSELVSSLSTESQGRLVPVVYRLGECHPFWAAAESPDPERLLPRGMRHSSLIGPLFRSLEDTLHRIDSVLIVAGATPLDLDDWVESEWRSKVSLYGADSSSFGALPKPLRVGLPDSLARFEASQLAAHLAGLERSCAEVLAGGGLKRTDA